MKSLSNSALTHLHLSTLTKLRNYEHVLYPTARARVEKLEDEVIDLKTEKA